MGFSYRAIAKQLGVSVGKVLELVRSQKGGVMNGRRNGVG
jgi:DNA-directed RNA polymerase specialized sigma24 family protein